MRFPAAVALTIFARAGSVLACNTLPLHVAGSLGMPPAFSAPVMVSFPHTRTPLVPSELYRAGDVTGADSAILRLYAVKGPGAGEVTLHATGGCSTSAPTFADTGISLRELHVDAARGTPGGDGSLANPFDTLQRAVQNAVPGDRIVLHQGDYPDSTYRARLQGTALNPIWITGAPGEPRPVLGSPAVGNAIQLSDAQYVVIQDVEVDGPGGNGINLDDGGDLVDSSHHVVVRRVEIRDIGTGGNSDCLKLSGVDDFWVQDSSFLRCSADGSGIDMVGCHRGRIERSQFRDGGGPADVGNAVQTKGGSSDVLIRGNLFVNAGPRALNMGGSTGAAYFRPPNADYEARNIQAIANVLVGSWAPIAFVGCDGCLAASNTIYLPDHWVIRILQETVTGMIPCRNGRFIDNIVVFDSSAIRGVFVNVGGNTQPDTFVFANNLWFARDDPSFSGPSLPVPESDPVIQLDPRLADPAAEDFRLGASSPAIAQGICYPEIGHDFEGLCYRDPPAIGAHEGP